MLDPDNTWMCCQSSVLFFCVSTALGREREGEQRSYKILLVRMIEYDCKGFDLFPRIVFCFEADLIQKDQS